MAAAKPIEVQAFACPVCKAVFGTMGALVDHQETTGHVDGERLCVPLWTGASHDDFLDRWMRG